MNLDNIDYEVLDLGLVYYKNILKDPEYIIRKVNEIDQRFMSQEHGTSFTEMRPWHAWQNESAGTYETFCWQKFFPKPNDINNNDYYYLDQLDISKRLYDALDLATDHYKKIVYPFADKNIKSREYNIHLLKYVPGGYLPAHQDQGVSTRVLSSVMYLNDNYVGGEIEFKQSNIKIKPKPGSIIFFPSNFLYVHEVYPIISGERYSMPHWYHNVDFNTVRNSTGAE